MQIFRTKSVEQTIAETNETGHALKRNLGWWDLAVMGVAVAVGAGIFSVGAEAAAFHAGPAVIVSFIIAGVVFFLLFKALGLSSVWITLFVVITGMFVSRIMFTYWKKKDSAKAS